MTKRDVFSELVEGFDASERTLANWEQDVSQPNTQAVILIRLIERHPELLQEIATL